MAGGIFLLHANNELTEMAETPFAAEVDFQKLLPPKTEASLSSSFRQS